MYSVMRLSAVGTPGRVYDTINRKTLRKYVLLSLICCHRARSFKRKHPGCDPVFINMVVSKRPNKVEPHLG